MTKVEHRIQQLGLRLPVPPPAAGNYQPWIKLGNLIFVSGQFPIVDGVLKYSGQLGTNLTVAEGYEAARLCGLNVLAQLKAALETLDRLAAITRLDGYINSASNWTEQSAVLNGASDLFAEVLADKAGHTRTVMGNLMLPMNAAIEIAVIAVASDLKEEIS